MYTGTALGKEFETELLLQKIRWKRMILILVRLPVRFRSYQWVSTYICDCFKVLCKQESAKKVESVVALTQQEIDFIDKLCNWTIAKNWAEWWMRLSRLQMLHKDFSFMDSSTCG